MTPTNDARDTVAADEIRVSVRRTSFALVTLVVTLVFIAVTFRPISAPLPFAIWAVAQTLSVAAIIVAAIAFTRVSPDGARIRAFWAPLGSALIVALNVVIAGSIWALLPGAPPALIDLMILLYCWYVFIQVAGDTGATRFSGIAMILVMLSLGAFVVVAGHPYRYALVGFFGLFAVTVLGLRKIVRDALIGAIEARVAAQAATAELEVALAQVAAERDARARFMAAASHDLQQPIQAASLYFGQVAKLEAGSLRDEATKAGRVAFSGALALIATIIDHLRLGASTVTAHLAPVDLPALLRQITAEAALSAAHGTSVHWRSSLAIIDADRALLSRALANVVHNAVRHSQATRIVVAARNNGGAPEIVVIDNGTGIPEALQATLFQEGAQGASSIGFGIGLASSRAAMRVQGGDVLLEPRWRGGTAFRLRLPHPRIDTEQLCAAA